MKKFFALILFFALFASCAGADPKISFNVYKCMVCDKYFQSFAGDNLDAKDFKDQLQLRRIFQFGDRGKNFPECKNGFKYHIFDRKGSNNASLSALANSSVAANVGVVRDGGALNITLTEWECVYCKKHFYSVNDENLNIKDWELQTNFLYNLKGRAIQKCSKPDAWGHIFFPKKTSSVKSYELATIANDVYWVKN